MRWAIAIAVLSAFLGASVAFAATLNVDSARVTVFTNTLNSPTISVTPSAASITAGDSASANASISGATPGASGTVRYTVYSDNTCTTPFADAGLKTVTAGVVPVSNELRFDTAATYYWSARYNGDGNNQPATSSCVPMVVTPEA